MNDKVVIQGSQIYHLLKSLKYGKTAMVVEWKYVCMSYSTKYETKIF